MHTLRRRFLLGPEQLFFRPVPFSWKMCHNIFYDIICYLKYYYLLEQHKFASVPLCLHEYFKQECALNSLKSRPKFCGKSGTMYHYDFCKDCEIVDWTEQEMINVEIYFQIFF